ncbi:superoxide dismutase [Desertibaculum subflavum]|uniref:superoxide dismutase n=1 Tax=Desertibaculum subflavum TaxID=2268458 RepID=UPI000E6705F9
MTHPTVAASSETYPFKLPPLPYAPEALAPVISANTLGFHHGKHHQAYVTNLNGLLENNAELKSKPMVEIIKATAGDAAKAGIFNNAAQVWNHTFFWNSLAPKGGGQPKGKMADLIGESFGSYDEFKKQLAQAGATQFGSGWAWLCLEGKKLSLRKTGNAENPLTAGAKPLLTIDVWEHAYYLDYQNRRPDFLNAVIDKLLNWEFAESNLSV